MPPFRFYSKQSAATRFEGYTFFAFFFSNGVIKLLYTAKDGGPSVREVQKRLYLVLNAEVTLLDDKVLP